MTNPRIQEIENQILELAKKDAELYPTDMPAEQTSRHHSPALGDWARQVIKFWQGEEVEVWADSELQNFKPSEPGSKFNLIKYIRDQGAFVYELTSPETQERLNGLVEEWNKEHPHLLAQIQAKDKEIAELTIAKEVTQRAYERVFEEVQELRGLKHELAASQRDLEQKDSLIQQKETQLTQTQDLNQKLQADNRDLLKDIQNYKQKITNLENQSQTQAQTIQNLQTQWTQHLTQEKSQIRQEIQLIKEVLHA